MWNGDFSRKGPALLLDEIERRRPSSLEPAYQAIVDLAPDLLLLTRFDHDLEGLALGAFAAELAARGRDFPHLYAPPQNRGRVSGRDLDGNGRAHDPEDAWGYGRFSGDGAMALLSRHEIRAHADLSGALWSDLAPARRSDPSLALDPAQPLASSGYFVLELAQPDLRLLLWSAGLPLFGARNVARNHDEAAFWLALLAGEGPVAPPKAPFVVMGHPNLGPDQGDGRALGLLHRHPDLRPPPHGPTALLPQGWARLSEIQPSAQGLTLLAAGVHPVKPLEDGGLEHHIAWVNLRISP